jgi:hypothetical protein
MKERWHLNAYWVDAADTGLAASSALLGRFRQGEEEQWSCRCSVSAYSFVSREHHRITMET